MTQPPCILMIVTSAGVLRKGSNASQLYGKFLSHRFNR